MPQVASDVQTMDALRVYVHERRLCRHENLVAEQFALELIPLTRKGNLCGMQFLLRGPRSVRLVLSGPPTTINCIFTMPAASDSRKNSCPHGSM